MTGCPRLADSAGLRRFIYPAMAYLPASWPNPIVVFTLPDMKRAFNPFAKYIDTAYCRCDAGFDDGGATVQAYEKTGAAGIQIEDQPCRKFAAIFPVAKLSRDEAVAKIADAVGTPR